MKDPAASSVTRSLLTRIHGPEAATDQVTSSLKAVREKHVIVPFRDTFDWVQVLTKRPTARDSRSDPHSAKSPTQWYMHLRSTKVSTGPCLLVGPDHDFQEVTDGLRRDSLHFQI